MKFSKILSSLSLAAIILMSAFITSCGKNDTKSGAKQNYITIKGSDTMVHLVSSWAEQFMKTHEGMELSVTGGGSGTGVAAILNRTTDICASSRDLKEEERKMAADKGLTLQEIPVARDGLAVVVNKNNPVTELSMAQLKDIFTGVITNWNQLGGQDRPIIILSRESNSGTFVFFQEHVLLKENFPPSTRLMPASSAIIQTAGEDLASIGYVGLAYALEAKDKVNIIKVKADENSPAVFPDMEHIVSGAYPIARPLYLFTNGTPMGTLKEFVDYCLSPAGQQIVKETGYITI